MPPVLEFERKEDASTKAGEELDRFTVDQGVVKITFPSGMTPDSVGELEEFFKLFINKAKRHAGAEKTPGSQIQEGRSRFRVRRGP